MIGKTVLITGAAKRVGRSIARELHAAGANIVVHYRLAAEAAEALVGELNALRPDSAACFQTDLLDHTALPDLVNFALTRFGRLDVLVNNAGIVIPGRIDTISEDDWEHTFAVNVRGTFLVSRHAVEAMRRSGGGVIVHVASVAAQRGVPDRAAYSASKGAVLALTRAMARDHLADNIRVNCVCPGTTETPSLERRLLAFPDPAKARATFVARQPMGRLGTPEEIAAAILFAASDEVSFMNGETISICGGMTI